MQYQKRMHLQDRKYIAKINAEQFVAENNFIPTELKTMTLQKSNFTCAEGRLLIASCLI